MSITYSQQKYPPKQVTIMMFSCRQSPKKSNCHGLLWIGALKKALINGGFSLCRKQKNCYVAAHFSGERVKSTSSGSISIVKGNDSGAVFSKPSRAKNFIEG